MKPRRAGCWGFVFGFSMMVSGCVHEGLLPAPYARVVPSATRMAYVRTTEVTVFIDGDAWRAHPIDLCSVLTPVWVSIENTSAFAIRVTYADFSLELPNGLRAHPVPPFSIDGEGPMRSFTSGAQGSYRDPYMTWREPLPTDDMLRFALSEGVLVAGARVSGFLYFPDLPAGTRGELNFRADFVRGKTGDKLARVDIPLVPK
jgi:hypothetical protein